MKYDPFSVFCAIPMIVLVVYNVVRCAQCNAFIQYINSHTFMSY